MRKDQEWGESCHVHTFHGPEFTPGADDTHDQGGTSVTAEAMLVIDHFPLQWTTYQQVFRTAMGSLVSLVVADLGIEHIEDHALETSLVPTVL